MADSLLALSFDCPVSPEIEFLENSDSTLPCASWGFAWYSGGDSVASLIHGGAETSREVLSQTLNDWKRFNSATFMCQFSQTRVENSEQNKQPFSRKLSGREWLWMSNGEIQRTHRDSSSPFTETLGTTGSEEAFCALLDSLSNSDQRRFADVSWNRLLLFFSESELLRQSQLCVSDGQYLIAFRGLDCEEELFVNRYTPPHRKSEIRTPLLILDIGSATDPHRSLSLVTNSHLEGDEVRSIERGGLAVLRRSTIVWDHNVSEAPSTKRLGPTVSDFSSQAGNVTQFSSNQTITTNIRSMTHTLDGEPLSFRRLRVTHKTTYQYARPVRRSAHHFRLSPVEDEVQEVESSSVTYSVPTTPLFYEDTFGNRAIHLTIERAYTEFSVTSEAVVKIYALPPDDLSSNLRRAQIPLLWLPWQRQMLLPYLLPPELPETQLWELNQYAMSFVERNDYLLIETLDDMNRTIFTEYQYQSGSTNLGTTPFSVYVNRRGVCQDFANLFICLARILNIPARYRMGYIYTGGDYENKEQSDASHAWVEVYLPYLGWRGFDPTNGCFIKQDHIRVACGRSYTDATPTSGTIYKGGGKETMTIDVKVTDGN